MKNPIRFSDDLERPEPDEERAVLDLEDALLVLRTTERALKAAGLGSATLKTTGGVPDVHPLGETCLSQAAFRHGDFMAKYALVPVPSSLTRHGGEEIDAAGRPDAIREAMDRDTRGGSMERDLRAPPQGSFDATIARRLDDSSRFSPWPGLSADRPLGAIDRVRRDTYRTSADDRARVNGCPVHEPASAGLPPQEPRHGR